MTDQYDSRKDTQDHIHKVKKIIHQLIGELIDRTILHDRSKLRTPEKEIFDKVTPRLKKLTYGSKEYKQSLADMGPALDHHYANNRHHAEWHKLWKCPVCERIVNEDQVLHDSDRIYCKSCVADGYSYDAMPYIGLDGMTLVDLVEMFCDWCAATERHADGDIMKSIEINAKRYHYGDVLKHILINTAVEYFMGKNPGKESE